MFVLTLCWSPRGVEEDRRSAPFQYAVGLAWYDELSDDAEAALDCAGGVWWEGGGGPREWTVYCGSLLRMV